MRRKKGQAVFGWLMGTILGASLLMGTVSHATEAELELVNLNDGITYVYSTGETPSVIGLNLNGNSVVIQQADSSTPEVPTFNVYIDRDKSGTISTGDERLSVKVGDETVSDFPSTYNIYGVYQKKSTTPISIAMLSGKVKSIYGVYQGEVECESETAVDIDISGSSTVTGTLSAVYGKDDTAKASVSGDVRINCDTETQGDISIGTLYGVNNYVLVNGAVDINMNNISVGSLYGLNDYVTVTEGYTCTVRPSCVVNGSGVYGMRESAVGGDVTISLCGYTGTNSSTNYNMYGIYCQKIDAEDIVGGKYTFEYTGGVAGTVYAISNANSNRNVLSDVEISYKKGKVKTARGVSSMFAHGNYSFIIDDECNVTSEIYAISATTVSGDMIANICNGNTSENMVTLRGIENSNVEGNANVVVDGGYYSKLYGITGSSNTVIKKDAIVTIANVNSGLENYTSNNYSYGVNGGEVKGLTTVNVTNSKFGNFKACESATCGNGLNVDISGVETVEDLYGACPSQMVSGDINCSITDVTGRNLYGVYLSYNKCNGGILCTITDAAMTQMIKGVTGNYGSSCEKGIVSKVNNSSSVDLYALDMVAAEGDVTVEIIDGTYGSATGGYLSGAYNSKISGETQITISDVDYTGSYVYPYLNSSGADLGDVTVTISDLDYTMGDNPYSYIQCSTVSGQSLNMTLDEQCNLESGVEIQPGSSSGGEATVDYAGVKYYGGTITFTEDVEEDTIYFTNGQFYIPKDVTVKADTFYFYGGNILLEGTLDIETMEGKLYSGSDKYSGTNLYCAGGILTEGIDMIQNVRYAIGFDYKSKGGTVTCSATSKHPLSPDYVFAAEGQEVTVTVTPKADFDLTGVTVKAVGEDITEDVTVNGSQYSFTMPAQTVLMDIDFAAKTQITLDKTEDNVSAKVGVASTAEAPLYDLSTITVSNDAVITDAEVTYEVDEKKGLPEGLSLEDGKIFGTPTIAYVDGKDTVIHVIGKNDTVADFTIHFVVEKKDCVFATTWSSDETHHWYACTDSDCTETKDKAEHTWDAGVVEKEATATEDGVKKYTCTVCNQTKTEPIEKSTNGEENNNSTPEGPTEGENGGVTSGDGEESNVGTSFYDAKTKATYIVTKDKSEVSYVKPKQKTNKKVTIQKTVKYEGVTYKITGISANAFKSNKKLATVVIGANVKNIGNSAFQNCTDLKKITIPTKVTKIGNKAFYGCKKLATVKIGKNVTTIGSSAFQNCTALKKIEIPSKVNKIGAKAFYGCKKMTSITIKTTKLNTKNVGKQAFTKAGSSNYKKLTVKVPKKKKKAYKTMLKKRGLSSKAKVK